MCGQLSVVVLLTLVLPCAALSLNLPLVQPQRQNNTAALCHWLPNWINMCVWCITTQVSLCVCSWLPDLIVSVMPSSSSSRVCFGSPGCLMCGWHWVAPGSGPVCRRMGAPPSSIEILLTGPNPPWDNAIPEGSWLKPLILALRYIKRRQLWSRGQTLWKHYSLTAFHHQSVLCISPHLPLFTCWTLSWAGTSANLSQAKLC